MPLTQFICPDDGKILTGDCLSHRGCRLEKRCAPIPYLRSIAFDREWRGITPSMAGNGARLIHLKRVVDYAVKPSNRAFSVLGVATHAKLAMSEFTYDLFAEEEVGDSKIKGILDLLEPDEYPPSKFAKYDDPYVLIDHKTWGSFKVVPAVGGYETQLLDPVTNEPILYVKGKKKGQPKTTMAFDIEKSKLDYGLVFQINMYRILVQKTGRTVSRMKVFFIVRDGGLAVANSRGLRENTYLVDVPFEPDDIVEAYYEDLRAQVDHAHKTGDVNECSPEDAWNGRRCADYCEVANECWQMGRSYRG